MSLERIIGKAKNVGRTIKDSARTAAIYATIGAAGLMGAARAS